MKASPPTANVSAEGSEGASGLRVAQRGAVDLDGVALVAQPAEGRGDESLVAEEVVPLAIVNLRVRGSVIQ